MKFNDQNSNLLTNFFINIEMNAILKKELKEKLSKTSELTALKNLFFYSRTFN